MIGCDEAKRTVRGIKCAAMFFWVLCLLPGAWGYGGEAVGGTDKNATVAMRRGLDWLKSVQKEDGSWSNPNFPAMTALGLWAFSRSEHPDLAEVGAKAAGFIARFAQEDGGIYKPVGLIPGRGGLSTYNTAVCMIALHSFDKVKYAATILKAREFMVGCQLVGDSAGAGGFGYDRDPHLVMKVIGAVTGRGQRGDLSNTGWAVRAMRETQDIEDRRVGGKSVDIDWKSAMDFVGKLQNNDKDDRANYGGFGYEAGGTGGGTATNEEGKVTLRGYGSMTYAGLESMIFAQVDRTDPRVRSALEWAGRHWSVAENPGMGTRGLFYYLNIMTKAMSLSGSDTLVGEGGTKIEWKKEVVAKLAEMQGEDGSWVNENNSFWEGDATLVTSYAVLALEYAMGR